MTPASAMMRNDARIAMMRNNVRAALLGAALLLSGGPALAAGCAPDQLDLRQGKTALRFSVEVADDAAERSKGLMFRESLPRFGGMFFVYDAPEPVSFWMRNTLIPLDMLFFDASGRLSAVHENAVPGDLTPIPGGDAIQYVLEINGGAARKLGIAPGAELRHPALDQDKAAWPCD
jgi:uncharacterized membrane protein (UPF0127 family)